MVLLYTIVSLSLASFSLARSTTKAPPLGFNTWNEFACNINETLIKRTADLLISTGLRDAGYVYVNLDDCWAEKERDKNGFLVANAKAFPSGLKALGDYLHDRGLLFGIYSDRGTKTCAGYPGSFGYEEKDAQTFANWGVDYLKYDNCYVNPFVNNAKEQYIKMGKALEKTGRDIFYSICSWGQEEPWLWGPQVGDSWRISGDIGDVWRMNTWKEWFDCPCTGNWCPKIVVSGGHNCSVLNILGKIESLTKYTSSLGYNDADMLEVGRGGMTKEEYQTHFAFWAALKSPLLIGADLAKLSPDSLALLTNKDLLEINQDPLRESIKLVVKDSKKSQIWNGRLADGSFILLILNEMDGQQTMGISFSNLGFPPTVRSSMGEYVVKNVLTSQIHLLSQENITLTIAPHDTVVLKVMPDPDSLKKILSLRYDDNLLI